MYLNKWIILGRNALRCVKINISLLWAWMLHIKRMLKRNKECCSEHDFFNNLKVKFLQMKYMSLVLFFLLGQLLISPWGNVLHLKASSPSVLHRDAAAGYTREPAWLWAGTMTATAPMRVRVDELICGDAATVPGTWGWGPSVLFRGVPTAGFLRICGGPPFALGGRLCLRIGVPPMLYPGSPCKLQAVPGRNW